MKTEVNIDPLRKVKINKMKFRSSLLSNFYFVRVFLLFNYNPHVCNLFTILKFWLCLKNSINTTFFNDLMPLLIIPISQCFFANFLSSSCGASWRTYYWCILCLLLLFHSSHISIIYNNVRITHR